MYLSGSRQRLRVFVGGCVHTLASEAYSSLEAPPYSAQCGSAPPDHLLFWNVLFVSCVFRQADIGPPIIGYSVVREKSLFIDLLSGASVRLILETFLTCYAAGVIFVFYTQSILYISCVMCGGNRVFGIFDLYDVLKIYICLPSVLACFETTLIYIYTGELPVVQVSW